MDEASAMALILIFLKFTMDEASAMALIPSTKQPLQTLTLLLCGVTGKMDIAEVQDGSQRGHHTEISRGSDSSHRLRVN